jgi:hypothetical protein
VDPEPTINHPPPVRSEGYKPTLGRKLFMLGLSVAGLIVVWVFWWLDTRKQ